jgi:hypothetical protein
LSAVTYLGFGVLQAKLLQRPGLREALGVSSLPASAKEQGVGPFWGWGGVEFVNERTKKGRKMPKTKIKSKN